MNEIFSNVLEKYIEYVKSHIAYGIMEVQQIARTNTDLLDCTDNRMSKILMMKHLTYEHINDYIYVLVHSDFLVPGERLGMEEMRYKRYKLFSIREIEKMFNNTIDVFYNGYKIPYTEIRIALFDDYLVLELPSKYKNYSNLNVIIHSYGFTEIYHENTIEIPKNKINDGEREIDNFLIFVDGKQTNNFTITEDDKKYIIRIADSGKRYEVSYYKYLNYYGKTKIKNSHINIMDVKRKFPIAAHNIITFSNGLLMNFNMEAKTDGVFKTSFETDDELDLFYVYKDYDYEEAYYNDDYRWLATFLNNFMDIINDPTQLPEFANEFKLFRDDISLQDFLDKRYTKIDKYNHDKTIDTIDWCEECLNTLCDFLYEEYKDYFATKTYIIDLSKTDINNYIRSNNKQEVMNEDLETNFNSDRFLIKIPNEEKYPFSIFIDGFRYCDNIARYRENGFEFIYITTDRIENDSIIEVELIRTKANRPKQISLVSDGTNKIVIQLNNSTFIENEYEINYLSLAKEYNNKFINDNENIKSIEYNKEDNSVIINLKVPYDADHVLKIYNLNCYSSNKFDTRIEGEGYDFKLHNFEASLSDLSHIRIYKNGREIPRKFYSIEFPAEDNDLTFPVIHIDIKYYIYEAIEVEFSPDKYQEVYYRERLLEDGKVDILHPKNIEEKFMNRSANYFNLNGRRITPSHYKYWCSKGISIFGYNSTHYFTVMMKTNDMINNFLKDFIEAYRVNRKLLDEYILRLMNGELYDPNNPPLKDKEDPCIDPDPTRTGKLYKDLYEEFLKLNIINMEAKIPEYIIIKYGGLIDTNNVLKIDANQKQLYWMPLDANAKNDYTENTRKILDLYYKLLDEWESDYIINPDEIPDDVYQKYKELFDNGCLVLQIPETYNED